MIRDNQRERVYRWERAVEAHCSAIRVPVHARVLSPLELESTRMPDTDIVITTLYRRVWEPIDELACRELVYKLREQGGIRRSPKIRFVEKGGAHYDTNSHSIRLPKWAMNPWVVTHEMCHAILDCRLPYGSVAAHGREFVGLLMHFLERNQAVDRTLLTCLANTMNVDFTNVSPKDLRGTKQSVAALPRR